MFDFQQKSIFITMSTGELESVCLILQNNLTRALVVDFSDDHVSSRNQWLAKSITSHSYLWVGKRRGARIFRMLFIFYGLLTKKLNLSLNYGKNPLVKRFKHRTFFFRDSIVPHIDAQLNLAKLTIYCEPKYHRWYKNCRIIPINDDSINFFLRKFVDKRVSISSKVLLISKNMNRSKFGYILKRDLYDLLAKSFSSVAVLPHPRETDYEISLARNNNFEIIDAHLLSLDLSEVLILTLPSSVPFMLEKLGYKFAMVFYSQEFAKIAQKPRFKDLAERIFYSNEELADWCALGKSVWS